MAMKGEYYTFTDEELPRYTGCDRVFGVGNVVTGQGNIRVSLVHSQKVTSHLVANYIRLENNSEGETAPTLYAATEAKAAGMADAIEKRIENLPSLSSAQMSSLEQRIRAVQERVGYTSDYDSWIAKVTPADLE